MEIDLRFNIYLLNLSINKIDLWFYGLVSHWLYLILPIPVFETVAFGLVVFIHCEACFCFWLNMMKLLFHHIYSFKLSFDLSFQTYGIKAIIGDALFKSCSEWVYKFLFTRESMAVVFKLDSFLCCWIYCIINSITTEFYFIYYLHKKFYCKIERKYKWENLKRIAARLS